MREFNQVQERVRRAASLAVASFSLALGAGAQSGGQGLWGMAPQAREYRGSAVSIEGQRLAVGVPQEGDWQVSPGAVQLFIEVEGVWEPEERLVPDDGAPQDFFGRAVALSGGSVAVGAPQHDSGVSESGAVYVFHQVDEEWVQQAKLAPDDLHTGAFFGASVDLEGDVLVVGAPHEQGAQPNTGAVYVFRRESGGWAMEQKIFHSGMAPWADYGASVSLDGDRLAIGAPKHASGSLSSGFVQVLRHVDGWWHSEQELFGDLATFDSTFGRSVTLLGDALLVGSRAEAAYLYEDSGSGWQQQQVLRTSEHEESFPLRFGHAVAMDEGSIVVAATRGDEGHVFAGAVFVFRDDGTSWVEDHRLEAPEAQVGAQFGYSLAVDGGRLLVGAPFESSGGSVESGAAYVFELAFAIEEFCFGDGSGALCPCGNQGARGHGCRNTVWTDGARLSHAGGGASFSGEGLTLQVVHALPMSTGVFLRSGSAALGGAGAPFGDGLRCVGSPIERLSVASTGRNGQALLELAPPDPTREVVGDQVVLQFWYRDPTPQVCGLDWNTSNAVRVTWQH